jgi:hypothetical protein
MRTEQGLEGAIDIALQLRVGPDRKIPERMTTERIEANIACFVAKLAHLQ